VQQAGDGHRRLTDQRDSVFGHQTVGVLQLLNKRSGTFDARDEEVAGLWS